MRIYFASHNQNKVKEIVQLAPSGIEIYGLDELTVSDEIPETGSTMEENSRIKANFIHSKFGMPVFADDSGLEVDALNGEPGVFSARYAGPEKDDQRNIDLLLVNLANKEDKSAQFKTVITYLDKSGKENQFTGVVRGTIGVQRKVNNGFGYDPIFLPEGYTQTFAEMNSKEKNELSHRAKAFKKLLLYLESVNE